jgi:histidinol-phosphatase (PHP family)
MNADYHIHTEYSYDSIIKAESLIDKAIAMDYKLIAITEHLDLLPWEVSGFGLPAYKKYVRQMGSYQEKFQTRLKLLCGLEVGDYHRVLPYARELLAELDVELITGAVHFLADRTNVAIPLPHALTADEIRDYYLQNLALVQDCDIDILAHLGVYKRYYTAEPDESACNWIWKDIFQCMIERGIALELNFSGLRKPYGRILPERGQIELYLGLGGKLVTFGSDAHQMEHFDLHKHQLPNWLDPGQMQLLKS